MAASGLRSMQIAVNLVNFLVMAIADCRNFHFVLWIACFEYLSYTVSELFLDQIRLQFQLSGCLKVVLFFLLLLSRQFFFSNDYRVL